MTIPSSIRAVLRQAALVCKSYDDYVRASEEGARDDVKKAYYRALFENLKKLRKLVVLQLKDKSSSQAQTSSANWADAFGAVLKGIDILAKTQIGGKTVKEKVIEIVDAEFVDIK